MVNKYAHGSETLSPYRVLGQPDLRIPTTRQTKNEKKRKKGSKIKMAADPYSQFISQYSMVGFFSLPLSPASEPYPIKLVTFFEYSKFNLFISL